MNATMRAAAPSEACTSQSPLAERLAGRLELGVRGLGSREGSSTATGCSTGRRANS